MREAMKKAIILIVLAIAIPVCLFADRWFTLSHTFEVEPGTGYAQFWTPDGTSSSDDITGTTIEITESPMVFSRLGLHYTGCFQMSLSLGYTELINKTDSSKKFPYDLTVLNAGEETAFNVIGSPYSQTINEVEYTMLDLYDGVLVGIERSEGDIKIADLKITLNPEESLSGTYEGTLIILLTEGNT